MTQPLPLNSHCPMITPDPTRTGSALRNGELQVQIGNEIRNIGIPPRPVILTRIHNEMLKEDPDFRMLADIIASDVGLAASIIKVANSPYFGFGKRVRTVPEALLVLGLKVTIQTIAGFELKKTFGHVPNLERFWDSASRTAHLCAWLAHSLQERINIRPDDAYTFGLFRDCGIPVLMIPFPEYAAILKRANQETVRLFTAVEDEQLSINHALIGTELATDWLLPEDTCQAIRYHHEAARLEDVAEDPLQTGAMEMIAIAQIVEHFIQQSNHGWNSTEEWGKLGPACLRLLAIDEDGLQQLQQDAATADVSSF